jgi:fibronectin type 3 domain-containing protein
LTLSGAASGQTKTDASGNYSFSGLANGSYLVAPSQSGYSFSPSTAAETVKGGNMGGVNFTASSIPPPVQHTVTLSWTASTSPNISGYNIYRATDSGGPYSKINTSLDAGTSYADKTVGSGGTYYYVTTAVNSSNAESGYSNQAEAQVPTP